MARTRSNTIGPASRPVSLPDDIDDPAVEKASGVISLPLHVRWSDPMPTYDLADPKDRARVYEQVLREGTEADVRFYIKLDELLEMWDDLVLPSYVRQAWACWLLSERSIQVAC
jgi:hypothetical protein